MDVIFVSTEAVPLAKTGGLADVCGVLPRELAQRGHQVSLIMPAFRQALHGNLPISATDIEVSVPIAGRNVTARVLRTTLAGGQVSVYLIDQPTYYDREGLYGDGRGDYGDNCERFAFFCRATLQAITRLGLNPRIVHCHDWQTGLIPAYVKTRFENHAWMDRAASVMTIHNLAYQGQFWHWDMLLTGLGWEYFNYQQMEFYGHLNLLKTGLVFADALTTVSPRYAEEIQTVEHGCGMENILRGRRESLTGIINGVDYDAWNPAHDRHLAQAYDVESWQAGKRANREAIAVELGLPAGSDLPLIGLVGRLATQKGWDLIIDTIRSWLSDGRPARWAILGTGEARYHHELSQLATQYPTQVGLHLGFSDALAHRIEAGSDVFLMPSSYEPCGLNQLYSLRYGSVPIVNPVGGLADTVVDTTPESLANRTATGFYLNAYQVSALSAALSRALAMWRDEPSAWDQIVRTGMTQDWSWTRSAASYEALYERLAAR